MGLLIDSTLDFAPETTPAAPAAGAKLWVMSDGQLRLTSVGGVTAKVMTDANRPPAIWFTTETGAPLLPTNASSPLYGLDVVANDLIVRSSDGEVFKYTGTAVNDQAFSLGAGNQAASTVCRAYLQTGGLNVSTSSASPTAIPLNVDEFDPGSHFSTSTYLYTVSVPGYYRVSSQLWTYGPAGAIETFIYQNGNAVSNDYQQQAGTGNLTSSIGDVLKCNAGDTIGLYAYASVTNAFGMTNGSAETFLTIDLVAPITAAPVTPNTAARAYRNAGMSLANGWQKVLIDTVAAGNDPGGHMDVTTNHRYNVSATGWYQVNSEMILTPAAGVNSEIGIYHNGAQVSTGGAQVASSGVSLVVSDLVYCLAGDYLETWLYTGGAGTLNSGAGYVCSFAVVQVDQNPARASWFFYNGTGTPTNIIGMVQGDVCVRTGDGEVFKWNGTLWVDQLLQFNAGQVPNANVSTFTRAWLSTATNLAVGNTQLAFNNIDWDNGPNFNTTTGTYTCPVAGYYQVDANVLISNSAANDYFGVEIFKNGTRVSIGQFSDSPVAQSGTIAGIASDVVRCVAGDQLTIEVYSSTAASVGVGGDNYSFVNVAMLAPVSAAPMQPNTGARAYRAASFALTANTTVKIPIDTVATGNDPGGHMDVTTNHRCNIASTGWYLVAASVNATIAAVDENIQVFIYHNGAPASRGAGTTFQNGAADDLSSIAADLIYCVAGDYLESWALCTANLNLAQIGGIGNYLSVVKVDQPSPVANTGWFTPTLTSPWSPQLNAPQYMKDASGFVHIRGSVSTTAGAQSSTPIFTLPVGFRPGISDYYWALGPSGGTGFFVFISTAGVVSGTTVAASQQLYFGGGMLFLAEN